MSLCGAIHNLAMRQGGGTTTFFCPLTRARITVLVGPGGTFQPTKVVPGPDGQVPTLDQTFQAQAPFAGARS